MTLLDFSALREVDDDLDPELRAAAHLGAPAPRLVVENLRVSFRTPDGERPVVRGLSFSLGAGECVAIVGESGSGKSVSARSLVGLTGRGSVVHVDRLEILGADARALSSRAWRRLRGRHVGFVLQDALVSLDPLRAVGRELDEALRLHGRAPRAERRRSAVELLRRVGVPRPEERARLRPDELSGGLRQRALIATAIAHDPEIVIADEPTTALDATVQAHVLAELDAMRARGTAVILISHDLSVVARLADRIVVMRGGEVVESGPAARLLGRPEHPYTQRLVAAVPGLETRGRALSPEGAEGPSAALPEAAPGDGPLDPPVVLEARGLVKAFASRGARGAAPLRAVDDVSFTLHAGETLGIVGESGSGKSTTARLALGFSEPEEGEVIVLGAPWSRVPEARRRPLRPRLAVVAQDPLSTFDPRWTVGRILGDALPRAVRRDPRARAAAVRRLLDDVGLPAGDGSVLGRFPLTLSGGQRQRVAIARALATEPAIIVLDEAVSALDVTIQAQILDLLLDLQRERDLAYLFISHDLGVIGHVSDRVLVMQHGRVVEQGPTERVLRAPEHPYTQELVASILPAPRPSNPPPGRKDPS
ncbi:ABC transporter ATP-binding protein [Microcella alkalica]|uniref:Peptide/nickel transport system ATP-binding protein n=1 Tax=Microcella alkalica TaxID=355930 RepID=A0A839EBD1_9MICO|nr:ABC transporter ATP-binding protein [Microcella alkalica]MBA8848463.1 peptide/nickel transport system ATP-binding protein [Microcella alkalica]